MSQGDTLTRQELTSNPQSLGAHTEVTVDHGGTVECRVELQGNITQSGHSNMYAL